ncbi:hypothetical protein [Clostridium sp. BL-8]|uniref:hypothetical protein n=1 Tax=Clostridium sp. BL-8 TaxID=349938 RepID=UPI00098C487A|nr:hypothetical protein [Clostridium sp. BL-8]OOM78811.1 hypothetical protein CLOBL_20590 [Clostridium sp. BL-8]
MNNNDKLLVGDEAKNSIKELFNKLVLNDIRELSTANNNELTRKIDSIKKDVTLELNVPMININRNVEELKEESSNIKKTIENCSDDALDEVEKIIGENGNNTKELIKNNKDFLLNEISILSKEVAKQNIFSKDSILNKINEIKEQLDSNADELHNHNNEALIKVADCKKTIEERLILLEKELLTNKESMEKEFDDFKEVILPRITEIESTFLSKNDELIKFYEDKYLKEREVSVKREKKVTLLFIIVIVLLVVCTGMIMVMK